MTTALLVITGLLVLTSAALYVESYRRDHAEPALAGMSVLIVASIPAIVYASLTS